MEEVEGVWKHLWLKPRRQASALTFQLEQGFYFPRRHQKY